MSEGPIRRLQAKISPASVHSEELLLLENKQIGKKLTKSRNSGDLPSNSEAALQWSKVFFDGIHMKERQIGEFLAKSSQEENG